MSSVVSTTDAARVSPPVSGSPPRQPDPPKQTLPADGGATQEPPPVEPPLQRELHALIAATAQIVQRSVALVRVSAWELEAAARARIRALVWAAGVLVVSVAAVIGVVIWSSIRIATEVDALVGGGVLGALAGAVAVLGPVILIVLVLRASGDRARVARRRREMS